eukprot:8538753-Alexandrium_andersonii.AAC.1
MAIVTIVVLPPLSPPSLPPSTCIVLHFGTPSTPTSARSARGPLVWTEARPLWGTEVGSP